MAVVLVKRCRVFAELYAFKKFRRVADAEVAEPELVIGCGAYSAVNGCLPCVTAARLVYKVGSIAAFQKDILKTIASVRRGFPCFLLCPAPCKNTSGSLWALTGFW